MQVWINAQVGKDLEKKVRIFAAERGVSKSEILRQALIKYLETEKKKEIAHAPAN